MSWHTGMTAEQWIEESRRQREREIARLRGLANFYNREADKLELSARQDRGGEE